MKVQTIENIDYFGEDAVFTVEKKQLTIYEVTRTAIAKDGSERTSTTYHLIEEHAKIAEERDILKSKLDIKRGKVECGGFKNTATLDFDNVENERITEIK